ncbi:MAG TPA: hypothetical protein VGH38_35305 [Bryobacteraceae bacterium]|jgi:hypothetical protein
MEQFLDCLQGELRRPPRTRPERQSAHGRLSAAFGEFGRTALGLEDRHLDLLLGGGLSDIGTQLARQARSFDSGVSVADLFQASRNAWTACGLQTLFGDEMRLTPAIFAYSMLYPYSDNYLDAPSVPSERKRKFNLRFGRRLAGEEVTPADEREAIIFRLVGLIEGQYLRERYPEVFASLLRIHRAQENSLLLLRKARACPEVDVLRLSFEKGGASVLADGYLAAGRLTAAQARFVFHWGVLLQLADDLQDVREDRRDGVLTLFSQAAGEEPLDALTNKTLHFGRGVMQSMHELPGPECEAMRQLIQRSCQSLVIRSAGEAEEFFTKGYLETLEAHSSFRFSFLKERRRRFARRRGLLVRLFEAFLAGDEDEPAFPLLPSSLMPQF